MARQYAQIVTAIWRDDDFRSLTAAEQHLYLLIVTQPDISAAGVLHLAITRWAGRACDTKPEDINRALDGLARRRFVVVDRDTEEVLARSFIRWDKGYSNPKRQPSIRDAVDAVESPALLRAIAAELVRIDMPMAFRGQAASLSDSYPDSLSAGQAWPDVPTMPDLISDQASSQVDSLPIGYPDGVDRPSDSDGPSERRVPQPTTRKPQTQSQNQRQDQTLFPLAPQNGASPPGKSTAARNADDPLFGEFYNAYPRKKEPTAARKAWDKAVRTTEPKLIIEAARRYAAERAGQDPQYTPYPASWLNAGGFRSEPDPPPGTALTPYGTRPARESTADARVAATLNLAASLEGPSDA